MSNSFPRPSHKEFAEVAPDVYAAMIALGDALTASGLDVELTELVKIRVSQINNCAFCLQYHLNIARRIGVDAAKLDLVATWREAGIFTAREMAALSWAEQVTNCAKHSGRDDAWAELARHFSSSEAVFLTVAVATINTWNRLSGAFHFAPPIPEREGA